MSANRSRSPGFLRIAPVDPGKQIAKLGGRNRDRAVCRARPQKSASLKTLRKQASALAVMPDHLQQVAAASAKAKQMAAQRIAPQNLLHLQGQAMGSLCACRCDPSPAKPARLWGPGSWSLPPVGNIENALQGAHVGAGPNPHAPPVRKLDLDAIIGGGRLTGGVIADRVAALR